MYYFDAHCHVLPLNVMTKSTEKGIAYFICNATSPADWDIVCETARQTSGVYPCIGVHPWYIENLENDWRIKMQLLLKKYPDMMIGEIGIDGNRPHILYQSEVFESCLKIARQYQRPVHIHGYKAWSVIIDILKCYPDITCLFHRFNGNEAQVKQLLNITHSYFSVMTTKPTRYIPPERVLVESDSPDGLHKPVRVIELAERLGLDWKQLNQNFENFIGSLTPVKGLHPRVYHQKSEDIKNVD